ncbi:uncharacterized protein P174DRAFT_439674 [Aspergillus novofumigatus IBT 16806]|uniref:Uncharacterized protein n=1 Tax=Aspergillus novofumigatus (strain IBT 16806) TaxID=1392255 RepID=A0A2I1CBP1_ASPN1|nr:uncharacterized protein P174DRAFT_439674 [Aspergillus novofumigatus IBT 16806]PKX95006.1 hypothetical protein P174DRAFT_439674 [Aspergillus novofumigatus IBT 16806]
MPSPSEPSQHFDSIEDSIKAFSESASQVVAPPARAPRIRTEHANDKCSTQKTENS